VLLVVRWYGRRVGDLDDISLAREDHIFQVFKSSKQPSSSPDLAFFSPNRFLFSQPLSFLSQFTSSQTTPLTSNRLSPSLASLSFNTSIN